MFDFTHIIVDGITYDLLKQIFGALIVSTAATFIAKRFKLFESSREILYVFSALFIAVFALIFLIAPRTQGPQLAGSAQTVLAGGINPVDQDQDTIAVIAMTILNSGSMQSVAKNWNVRAIIDSKTYDGAFLIPAPKEFRFNATSKEPGRPTGIIYHGDDSLIEKTMNPIATGGMVAGDLFVAFRGVPPSTFSRGADFVVTYEDALSRKYFDERLRRRRK